RRRRRPNLSSEGLGVLLATRRARTSATGRQSSDRMDEVDDGGSAARSRSTEAGIGPERVAAFAPTPQRFEREDPCRMAVVPRDGQTPRAVQLGVLDTKR